jgi:hypothetical protein
MTAAGDAVDGPLPLEIAIFSLVRTAQSEHGGY